MEKSYKNNKLILLELNDGFVIESYTNENLYLKDETTIKEIRVIKKALILINQCLK